MIDLFAPAVEQAAALQRREFSSVELTRAYLDRIEAINPKLNAYVRLTPELALEQANAADAQKQGAPLHGVPASIKELVSLRGYPTTLGSKAFEHMELPMDSFSVSQLKAAGCPILGKTNTSEFGTRPTTEWGLFGATHNPWNPEHTPGGSSGGAATAVAAGLCGFAQGSDGGGSVRIPASCCGVVGLKPSRGRVSPGPMFGEGWAGLSTDGVIARTVADVAAGLDAISGHLPGDTYWAEVEGKFADAAKPAARKLRVGFATAADAKVETEVADLVRSVANTIAGLGHDVSEGGPDTNPFRGPFQLVVTSGVASLPIAEESLVEPVNQASIAFGKRLTAVDYVRAVDAIRVHARQVVSFWDDHDVLITPTIPRPAPKLGTLGANLDTAGDEFMEFVAFTYPYNCTGQPAMSLPLGMSSAGLPIGVQLVGPPRGESVIIALAAQLEQALPWKDRRPPV